MGYNQSMSSFGSSTGPINRQATSGSHRPDAEDGTPRDAGAPTKHHAAGGPGSRFSATKHDICERLRNEVVWEPEVGQLLADAANEIERLRGLIDRTKTGGM